MTKSNIAILGTNDHTGTILLNAGNGERANIQASSLRGTYNEQVQAIATVNRDYDTSNFDIEATTQLINEHVVERVAHFDHA